MHNIFSPERGNQDLLAFALKIIFICRGTTFFYIWYLVFGSTVRGSLSGVILPPQWLNFDGKPRQFGKNREVHFAENPPRTLLCIV